MGQNIELTSADGFVEDAYRTEAEGEPKGCVVIIQEIFGVNEHIRNVVDGYAAAGYTAIAPALFDRAEKGVDLGYDMDGMQKGAGIARGQLKPEETLADIQAAVDSLKDEGKVAVIGYCFGGTMAWSSACNLENVAASVCYYGGQVPDQADQQPKCPTILHFGDQDKGIPLDRVEVVKNAHPDLPVYVYEGADHGFNCDARAQYHEASAKLALERTLAFLEETFSA